jgi:Fe-Mn family superoxide dismutase
MDINNLAIGPKINDYISGLILPQYVQLHFEGHHIQYQKKLVEYFNKHPSLLEDILNYSGNIMDNSYHPLSSYGTQKLLEKIIVYGLENNNSFLYNNAAQIWNHNLLWTSFTTNYMSNLENFLQNNCPLTYQQIIKDFHHLNNFIEEIITAHEKLFGNIWVWICWDVVNKKLEVKVSGNASSLSHYHTIKPLLVIDLWEHAYYGQYQNKKLDYINNMINYLNWPLMESMLKILSI